jgi:3-hydroxyisobutyrate dehydrogenase-like beta-hydroxyacid dehydrogenase
MSKDMDLVMDEARTSGADLPAARAAHSVLAANVSAYGDLNMAAITPFVAGRTRNKQTGRLLIQ